MTPAQAIEVYEEWASRLGGPPPLLALTVYETAADMAFAQERCPGPDDLERQQAATEALAAHARARGTRVVLVPFRPGEYRAWLAGRTDDRAMRAQWATEEAMS